MELTNLRFNCSIKFLLGQLIKGIHGYIDIPCVLNSQNDHDTIVVHAWDQQLRKEQINDVCYKTDGQIWMLRWYSRHWDRLFLCHFFIAILFVVYADVKKVLFQCFLAFSCSNSSDLSRF